MSTGAFERVESIFTDALVTPSGLTQRQQNPPRRSDFASARPAARVRSRWRECDDVLRLFDDEFLD